MTQSSSLGAVASGLGSAVRAGFNTAHQAIVTQSEGTSTPTPTYPFMLWRNNTSKLIKRRNAANDAWEIIQNYGATTNPTTGDDAADGYVRGAVWINTTGNRIFTCTNPTTASAVWTETAPGVPSVFGRSGPIEAVTGDYTASQITDTATKVIMTIEERNKLGRWVSVKDFGAIGNGIADDTTAFIAAATFVTSNGTGLWIPSGKYILKQQIQFPNTSVGIVGDGVNLSEVRWASDATSYGFLITANNSKYSHLIRDITFSTVKKNIGTAITLDYSGQIINASGSLVTVDRVSPRFLIDNCFFVGSTTIDSGNAFDSGWNTGVEAICALSGNIINCNYVGAADTAYKGFSTSSGFYFRGSPAEIFENGHPVQFVVRDSTLWFAGNAVAFLNCEGCYVQSCNIVACITGVFIRSTNQHPQLNVANSHINAWSVGILVENQAQSCISGCLIYGIQTSTNFIGILLLNAFIFQCIGNTFSPFATNANGIVVQGGSYGAISNNCFQQQSNFMSACIWLTSGSHHCQGAQNVYSGSFNFTVLNQGSSNSVS